MIEDDGVIEPSTYQEVAQNSKWKKIMEEEIQVLRQNEAWNLVPKPRVVKRISCKWVYKIKTRPNGSVEKYKARLIAHGLSQKYGLDYDEMFSLAQWQSWLQLEFYLHL